MKSAVLLCALATTIMAGRADAQVLYGATSSGGPGALYTLNPASGAVMQSLGPTVDAGGINYPITGLAFNPIDGQLYGSTGNSQGSTSWARLVKINPATAQVTVVGLYNAGPVNTTGTPATMADITFTTSGQLYGISSIGTPNLYSIDPTTGQATLVGSGNSGAGSFTAGGGIATSLAGVLYSSPTTGKFGTFDPVTGLYTNIGSLTFPAGANTGYAAFAFNGNTLYADDLGSPPHLTTIDTTTAAVTDLGTSVAGLDAIAFSPAPVPEPGTMALVFGAAIIGTAARRRKAKA
ncbi:MAG TPA: PEP-CTERM sorting domain-containing protein [Gemmataceae bacterium]|jgi:hypothetical protein|nr:PEP-CTERM sorting domain-containing protein [Gemmataceae bacterium]